MDVTVETSSGTTAHLGALLQKPTVLFYEDRDSNHLNQHVKEALFARGKEKGLLDSVGVVAVANVAPYDWFPARNFVLAAVRDIERDVHVPVYLDFKGAMTVPPWSLSAKSSTILVVSSDGGVLWQKKGRLSETDLSAMFEVLQGELKR